MKVYIMRGIPGSGKSRWVKLNLSEFFVASADLFFTDLQTGEYKFDVSLLAKAHDRCLLEFTHALTGQYRPTIVVDNTNRAVYEIAPYYRLAEAHGLEVEIVWLHCHPEKAIARGTHGVPPEKVMQMAVTFEPLPAWWKVRHIYE